MPQFSTVIEPFAGSACYALMYHKHAVELIDVDPIIAGLWQWLIAVSEKEFMALPTKFDDVADLDICAAAQAFIGFWLIKGAAQPVRRRSAWGRCEEWKRQFWGDEIKQRIARQLRYIRHWRATHADYATVRNQAATWFVDPPYQTAGCYYTHNSIDYRALGRWCRSREGQVIVCEQDGANWLPFEPFKKVKALRNRTSQEVVFLHGFQGRLL